MPTRKQRRRRAKLHRHEYEEVWVDEEGREVEPPPDAVEPVRGEAKRRNGTQPARGRTVNPPSWQRVAKRGVIFAPLMFLTVAILSPEFTMSQKLVQTVVLLGIFLPFSYFMDLMVWRLYVRRRQRG